MTADDIIKVWDAVFANYCCGWLVVAYLLVCAVSAMVTKQVAEKAIRKASE